MRRKLNIIVLTILLVFVAAYVDAQCQYRFNNLNKANGLNNDVVTAITEDGAGFIWLGTQTGLLRYDGQSFVPISNINDSITLEGSSIIDLKTDSSGDIWIATDHGMSKYDIENERLINYYISHDGEIISTFRVEKIFITSDNRLLFFSSNGYLYVFNETNKVFEACTYDFFSHRNVKSCFVDDDNTIWAVDRNASSIYHVDFEGNLLDSLECKSKYPFPLVETNAFLNLGDGKVWLGTYAGIYQIDVNNKSVTLVEDIEGQHMPKSIKTFFKRDNGDVWIGTNAEELFLVNLKDKSVSMIESDHSQLSLRRLNSVTVNTIYEDSNSLMWFGTWHGISFMSLNNPLKFNAISYPENSGILRQNQITAITLSPEGLITIGSDGGGIVFWDGQSSRNSGVFTEDSPNSHMKSSSILAMAYDKEGNLWTGGYNNPLHKLSRDHKVSESYSLVNTIKGVTSDFIADILIDRQDRIWVLTNGAGLLRFDPKSKKFTRILCDSRLVEPVSMYGTCLCEGPDSTILVGTYSGLYVYYPNHDIIENYAYSYGSQYSIAHNVVNDILYDSHNRVWVATPAGIDKFDIMHGIFTHYTGDNAIKNDICSNIIEDWSHDLWITTNNGILKFNPEVNKVTRLYDTDDGLLSTSFERHAVYVSKKGAIYIGTHDGVVYFNAPEIQAVTKVAKPVITSLLLSYNKVYPDSANSILKRSISCTDSLEFDWDKTAFSFEFTVLDYLYGKNIKILYRLDGYQNTWTDIGTRRELGFTNLNPGVYTLRLIAENSDRIRSEERTLVIRILPPWYKTKAAIACLVLLGLLLFWLIHVLRVRGMRRRQTELEQIVDSRTLELVNLNSVLEQRNEEMMQQKEEIQSQRDELYEKNNQLHSSREAIQQSYHRLLALSELDKHISSSTNIESILQKVYNNEVVSLAGCGLCICKRTKNPSIVEFSPYIENDEIYHLDDEKLSELTEPLTFTCFHNRQEIVADNSSDYEVTPFLAELGYRTCVRIPLFNADEVCAVMIINSHNENAFTKNDIAIFKVIASYSEIVIEKADAYSQIASKNAAINGSIFYAKTIQKLFLPQIEEFKLYFDAEVIDRPKDIVSGDYVWQCVEKSDNGFMIFSAVVDCTGHGVPGAFMSLISNQILREVVQTMKITEPMDILAQVSETTAKMLKQDNGENKDGMDMSLCRFDVDAEGNMYQFVYSGAKCPILFSRHNSSECVMIPADRISIAGGFRRQSDRPQFTQQVFEIIPGDTIYMYSDGIIDLNNTSRARFGRKRLIEAVNSVSSFAPDIQKQKMECILDSFSTGTEQRDDITLLILKVRDKVELQEHN